MLMMLLLTQMVMAQAEPRRITVASKQFTENVVLGAALMHLARGVGYEVDHHRALGGSGMVLTSLRGGQVDAFVEYTGTLLREHYARHNLPSMEALRPLLAEEGLTASGPLGFNNGYAIGMKRERADALGIRTLSDLQNHPQLRFALNQEFLERADTWPGLVRAYNLPQFAEVRGTEHEIALRAVASGEVDATDLYTTDAEIQAYDLVALEDDRHYFPPYDAVILYRTELEQQAPEVVAAFELLVGRIDEAAMQSYNVMATIERLPDREVAAKLVLDLVGREALLELVDDPDRREIANLYLDRLERIAGGGDRRSTVSLMAETTWEHLRMVLVSLAAGIAVAVPLGIVAAKARTFGQLVLPIVGILQTIPSLALLVFMIPLLGLGFQPAVVALFLYSLLPMVRNTQAGLLAVPPNMKESAEALGLSPLRQLWLIELPLALPSIVAGVKTSTVLTIGFATLGAFIGAGGYGEPILAGLRRNDTSLILQGAVPAALMAIAAQFLLDGLGRVLVPHGLRLTRG